MHVVDADDERAALGQVLEETGGRPKGLVAQGAVVAGARGGADVLDDRRAIVRVGEQTRERVDAAELLDDLDQRPERDAGAVQAPSHGDRCVAAQFGGRLPHEP